MKKGALTFKIVRNTVKLFYPNIEAVGIDSLFDEPVIIVGNHSQMHGPIACELYLPDSCYTWCAGQMMKLSEVPEYAYSDFWSQKPVYLRPFFKMLSYIIAPLSVAVFNNARTVAVYRDTRILSTFRDTVNKLQEGKSIVIFPEHSKEFNNIIYDFQDSFADVARIYFKRTGKEIKFVPLYIAPKLKKMFFGKPVTFSSQANAKEERRRICDYLMKEITDIATGLPQHTVVPYRNIPKKNYPINTVEVSRIEKNCP